MAGKKSDTMFVRAAAAVAFAYIGDARAIEPLERIMADENEPFYLRYCVEEALNWLRAKAHEPAAARSASMKAFRDDARGDLISSIWDEKLWRWFSKT